MSAVEDTRADDTAGKSTRGGSQPPAGEATPPVPSPAIYPHLAYADHVHAELLAAGLQPDFFEAGVRRGTSGGRELFIRAVWLPTHPELGDEELTDGLTLVWSHVTGWAACLTSEDAPRLLDVDLAAAPRLLADAALHLGARGTGDEEWTPPDGPPRWEHAGVLDVALAAFEDQEALR